MGLGRGTWRRLSIGCSSLGTDPEEMRERMHKLDMLSCLDIRRDKKILQVYLLAISRGVLRLRCGLRRISAQDDNVGGSP